MTLHQIRLHHRNARLRNGANARREMKRLAYLARKIKPITPAHSSVGVARRNTQPGLSPARTHAAGRTAEAAGARNAQACSGDAIRRVLSEMEGK